MRRMLLVIDLEGVAGVRGIDELVAETPGYRRAQRWLTEEVKVVTRALLESGFDRVRISDSHISGSGETNLLAAELDPRVELRLADDPYEPSMFDAVHAVAALGMHAPAGSAGFAAHTINLHSRWSLAGRLLSETDLLMGLAAERGLPFCFASGDEVLAAHLPSALPFLVTKRMDASGWVSLPRTESLARLDALARRAPPSPAAMLGDDPILLRFKSQWQAELAEEAGGTRVGALDFAVGGGSFRSRYERAWQLTEAAAEGLEEVVRGSLGSAEFVEDVSLLLGRGFERVTTRVDKDEIERCLRAFWTLTEGETSEARALRALILHMFEHHAPRVFRELELGPLLESALLDLALVPAALEPSQDADELQARVDARYVEHARGRTGPVLDEGELGSVLIALERRGDPLYAFILASMAKAMGTQVAPSHLKRPSATERVLSLYVLTHELLFESAYLTRRFARGRFGGAREQLLLASPWIIAHEHVDLAAEVAILLQALGEERSLEHRELLSLVRAKTSKAGHVLDHSLGGPPEGLADHATGVALLAWAGAAERSGVNQ